MFEAGRDIAQSKTHMIRNLEMVDVNKLSYMRRSTTVWSTAQFTPPAILLTM